MKNHQRWFQKNYDWIRTWIDTAEPYDDFLGMQIFRVPSVVDGILKKTMITNSMLCPDFKRDGQAIRYHALKKQELEWEILHACVISIEMNPGQDMPGLTHRTMSGFMEQVGRRPKKKDRVVIKYLEGNGITRWFSKYELLTHTDRDGNLIRYSPGQAYQWLSECRLEIL